MMNENTKLIVINNYNPKKSMIFSKPILGEVPGSKPKVEFRRIKISTKNEDGTEGELVIRTSRLYSFGVSESFSTYSFPLCLWSGNKPTEEEEKWIEKFNQIVDCCIDHILENKEEIDRFELVRSDLTKTKGGLNPLYWKMEKIEDGKNKPYIQKVPDRGPTLYPKLISYKKGEFLTKFYDIRSEDCNETINPKDLINKGCHAECSIKIESIFIGARISLQVKLYDALVETKKEIKRLAPRRKYNPEVIISDGESASSYIGYDEDSDDGSLT